MGSSTGLLDLECKDSLCELMLMRLHKWPFVDNGQRIGVKYAEVFEVVKWLEQ